MNTKDVFKMSSR